MLTPHSGLCCARCCLAQRCRQYNAKGGPPAKHYLTFGYAGCLTYHKQTEKKTRRSGSSGTRGRIYLKEGALEGRHDFVCAASATRDSIAPVLPPLRGLEFFLASLPRIPAARRPPSGATFSSRLRRSYLCYFRFLRFWNRSYSPSCS